MSTNIKTKTGVYTCGENDYEFEFKTSLTARDKVNFVASVVETVVGDHYLSVLRGIAFDFCVIEFMTDVDTSEVTEAPNSIDAMEQFVNETNIVEIVEAFNNDLINDLNKAVDLDIEYKTGIHVNPIGEALSSLLNTVEEKVNSLDVSSMSEIADALSGISGEMTADKFLAAYANSDLMKKRFEDAVEKSEKHAEKVEDILNDAPLPSSVD